MKNISTKQLFSSLDIFPPEHKQVLAAKIFVHLKKSSTLLLGITTVMGIMLMQYLPVMTLVPWIALVYVVVLYRLYLSMGSGPEALTATEFGLWYRRYAVAILLTAFLYGLSTLYLVPLRALDVDTTAMQLLIFITLFGISSTTVSMLSPDAKITIAYLMLTILPVTLVSWYLGHFYYAVSILSLFYLIMQVGSVLTYNHVLFEEYQHKEEILQAKDRLLHQALYDPLTALRNRRAVTHDIEEVFLRAERQEDTHIVLCYLDLDNFRYINNTFGHTIGDLVLSKVAGRLKNSVAETCEIYRIGGDEFLALYTLHEADAKTVYGQAEKFGRVLHALFEAPFSVSDILMPVQCSIGIAVADTRKSNVDQIAHYADIAMYQAKRTKSSEPVFFTEAFEQENQELLKLRNDLTHNLHYDQLVMHYQPIVSLRDNQLIGAEALVRWKRPDGSIVPPDQFIPLATELNLIYKITWWIIRHVLGQINTWQQAGRTVPGYVSINITPSQLLEDQFSNKLMELLEEHSIPPEQIRLEITEIALVEDFEKTKKALEDLKERGVLCMLDDFGTGYSSISYLNRFPLSTIKIDKIFIQSMLEDPKDLILTQYIIDVAEKLGYSVVAEGIETLAQKKALEAIGGLINYQGYLFSRPRPSDEFEREFLLAI